MKKFGLFLFAAFAALGLASCNDTKSEGPDYQFFVTAHTGAGGYYFEMDNGKTVWPGDKRVNISPAEGQRALILISLLDVPVTGYDYNAVLYGYGPVDAAPVEVVATAEELAQLKNDPTVGAVGQFSGDWINLIVRYTTASSDQSSHKFRLIVNRTEPDESDDGYLTLELRHDAGSDRTGYYNDRALSFKTDGISGLLEGKEGVVIRYNDGIQEQTIRLKRASAAS